MATKLTINSDASRDEALEKINALYLAKRFLRINVVAGLDRSIAQNDTTFHLYELIGEWFYSGDTDHARAECKLILGLPLIREGDPDQDDICKQSIDRLSYENQLKFIRTMDVSSLMSVAQCRMYIDRIIDHYAINGMIWPDYLTTDKSERNPRAKRSRSTKDTSSYG